MQRVRNFILMTGLVTVFCLTVYNGFQWHKALAYPVNDSDVAVYKHNSETDTDIVFVRDTSGKHEVKTDQGVKVYLFYAHDDAVRWELIRPVSVVVLITFVAYFLTYLIKPSHN